MSGYQIIKTKWPPYIRYPDKYVRLSDHKKTRWLPNGYRLCDNKEISSDFYSIYGHILVRISNKSSYRGPVIKIWLYLKFSFPNFEYSRHPNTELPSVFELHLMPVPIIRISNRPKTGLCVRFASLDRFIKKRVMNKIFFMPKRSRLAENFRSGFQMVKTKWRPKHSKSGQISPVPTIWNPDSLD